MKRVVLLAPSIVCAGLVACDDGFKPPPYALDALVHTCSGFSDPVCDGATPVPSPLPDGLSPEPPLGLGARIDVKGGTTLTPERMSLVTADVFQANALGIGAILDGHDVTHYEVLAPATVRLTHEPAAGSNVFTEIVGTDNVTFRNPDRLRAVAIDIQGNMLAGDLGCSWTTSDPNVVTIESDPGANIVTFDVVGPGQATLHVDLGSVSKDLPLTAM